MRRALVLLAAAGCAPDPALAPADPAWTYAPVPVALFGAPIARLGRSQAPQVPPVRGIAGTARTPLRAATPLAVPGDGKARAVLYGTLDGKSALELVDVDAGQVVWRDTTACGGPVVGVAAGAIVCADATGVRGVGLDGKRRWELPVSFLAMTEDRVIVEGAGTAVIVDAASGDELSRVRLPAGVMPDAILASCGDAGRELFAQGQDGRLVRIADAKGGAAIAWGTPIGKIDELAACEGGEVLVREAGVAGGTLIAIERATGKVTGRIEGVQGYWPARAGGGLEVSTRAGLARWPRDLTGEPAAVSTLVLGELIDARGELRLVRATPASAVVLDARGVRAYVPFAPLGGVLGDTAIVAASWGEDDVPRRLGIPPRYRRTLRLPLLGDGVALPAELRDLPAAATPGEPIAPGGGTFGVLDAVLDVHEPAVLYTLTLEQANEETSVAGVAAIDLATRAARWRRADACGTGEAIRIAAARDVVVCASRTRTPPSARVRATARDGSPRWEHTTDHVADIAAAGDAVLVFDAGLVTVLDAATGAVRWRIASDDGARAVATAVGVGAATFVVAVERGHVVARTLGGWPVWAIAVDGIARALQPSGTGVIVALEDGDAYRIELPAGTVHALPGLGLAWHGAGDLVVAHTAGGPIPGTPVPPAAPLRVLKPVVERPPPVDDEYADRPKIWTPIPPPPPLGDSVQVTLFELTGGLRARNDYGLASGEVADRRGPVGSPVVVFAGRDVLALDPRTGDPLRRVALPDDLANGLVFGTIVEGAPVAGAVLQAPLRIVIF